VFFYVLCFGGTMFGCVAAYADEGRAGWLKGLVLAHPYAFYSWLLWPVLLRATARQLTDRNDWAKTQREALPTSPQGSGAH
jgi:hypothetical protein